MFWVWWSCVKCTGVSTPDLFKYLDYRAWLRDWFEARKAANPRFSHRAFVRRTGQRSPSLLADVIGRRRNLTPALVERFSAATKLTAEEARFFGLLVALDQAQEPDERNRVWEKIAASRRFLAARRIEGESFRYVSRWYYPAIRELARRSDFEADPAWIAQTLVPRITTAQARDALRALVDLGMLTEVDGRMQQTEGAVVTPREVAGLAAHNYHQGMLERAIDGIRGFKAVERHYTGVTVCVPEALMPQLKKELNVFAERLLEICDSAEGAERVLQINLNLFPLSASVPVDEDRGES